MQRNLFRLVFFLTQADPSKQAKRSHTREASMGQTSRPIMCHPRSSLEQVLARDLFTVLLLHTAKRAIVWLHPHCGLVTVHKRVTRLNLQDATDGADDERQLQE